MHVVRGDQAPFYDAPGHRQMAMRRLQGMEAGPTDSVWIGLSLIEPGGGTTSTASDVEKFYVVLEGEIRVTATQAGESTEARLKPLDSCRIAPGEARKLDNPTASPTRLLLIMPVPR
jgi:mannose-6-phosphate isomerase-like protein (cupin superfamily)